MLTGFNNNIVYKDDVYHVQTENTGTDRPVITTFIYRRGQIVASKKMDYKDVLGEADADQNIRQLMENQHKNMIRALLAGNFDA